MEMHSRRIASYVENTMWDDDDDANVYNEMTEEVIRLASDKKEEIDAYIAILAPYGFTYLVVVNLLVELIGNSTLESDFIKTCIKELTRQIECGECPYSMLICRPLSNASSIHYCYFQVKVSLWTQSRIA